MIYLFLYLLSGFGLAILIGRIIRFGDEQPSDPVCDALEELWRRS